MCSMTTDMTRVTNPLFVSFNRTIGVLYLSKQVRQEYISCLLRVQVHLSDFRGRIEAASLINSSCCFNRSTQEISLLIFYYATNDNSLLIMIVTITSLL
jgi:hypothetical protein